MTRASAAVPAGVPVPLVASAGAAAFLVVVVALVPPGPGVPPFVLHIAEVLLAGGAAYAFDDAAAPLTGVTPQPLWRRRVPGLVVGAAVIAAATGVIALVLGWQRSLPGPSLASEVLVLCLLAAAAAALVSRRGETEPGGLVAPGVALIGLAALVAGPLLHRGVFLTDGGDEAWWWLAGVLALGTIVLASRDPASRATSLWVRSPRRRSTDSGSA